MLKPLGSWDGEDQYFKFNICSRSYLIFANDPESRRSINGSVVCLNDALIAFSSVTQKLMLLSVTKALPAAVVNMVQDMMYIYRVVTSIGLHVELPMVAEMESSGECDHANSWSIGRLTRHIDVWMFFL